MSKALDIGEKQSKRSSSRNGQPPCGPPPPERPYSGQLISHLELTYAAPTAPNHHHCASTPSTRSQTKTPPNKPCATIRPVSPVMTESRCRENCSALESLASQTVSSSLTDEPSLCPTSHHIRPECSAPVSPTLSLPFMHTHQVFA